MSNGSYRPTGFGGFSLFPKVIKNLLIINGAIFLVTLILNGLKFSTDLGSITGDRILDRYFALWPLGSGLFMPWQLITYQFMHADLSHIFFNMFGLWMFGQEIENLWGSKKFLLYYLLCGLGGGLLHLLFGSFSGNMAPTVGASGAIYGVMLAFALVFPDRYILLWFVVPVKAKYLIGFLMVLEFLMVNSTNSTIAHLAHLGGALFGLIFILLDKNIQVDLKDMLGMSRKARWNRSNQPNESTNYYKKPNIFQSKTDNIVDADYKVVDDEEISQAEIDKILDKISQSGYQNLTAREKKILFEASKRMK